MFGSTIAHDVARAYPPTHTPMALPHRLLLATMTIAIVAALVDPAGRLLVMLLLLLFAPGYLIERLLTLPDLPLLTRATVWIGLSFSIIALLYQWVWAIGLTIATPLLWGALILLVPTTLVAAWYDLGRPEQAPLKLTHTWPELLCALIILLTFWVRLDEIGNLAFPPWVDSVHHALLIRVAAEQGSVPVALAPYLPVSALPYHWGYHVLMATLMRLSGLDLINTMLLGGQLLNGLHALTIAGLARYLWRRPVAAMVAALLIGFISLMPAYYLSWGRYTQLSGLLLLPGLVVAWSMALKSRQVGWWLITTITLAGLSLIHLIVLIFGLTLLATLTLVVLLGEPWQRSRQGLLAPLLASLGAMVLAAPWLIMLARRSLLPGLATGGLLGNDSFNAFNSGLLWVVPNQILVPLALVAALLGLRRRTTTAALLLIWVALALLIANPWMLSYTLPAIGVMLLSGGLLRRRIALILLGVPLILLNPALIALPYLWLINNDALVISLFMPITLLIAGGAALLYASLERRTAPPLRRALAPASLLLMFGAGIWGMYYVRPSVLNQSTLTGSPAERAAIDWVATHTPTDARFLVNTTFWMPDAYRGVDAGWWILPLTGRWTTTPPVLFIYGDPDYVRQTQTHAMTLADYRPGREEAIFAIIATERITHIYLVEGRGPLTQAIFSGRPGFSVIYAQDGVTIIAVEPGQSRGATLMLSLSEHKA